jgi:hypothetical protein
MGLFSYKKQPPVFHKEKGVGDENRQLLFTGCVL